MNYNVTAPKGFTIDRFLLEAQKHNYHVYRETSQSFNLNIVGWRRKIVEANKFNDVIAVYWQQDTVWRKKQWPATTIPGVPWLLNPVNKNGTAIVVPGQYTKVYALGQYKGYTALKQVSPIKVFRDSNRDTLQRKIADKIPGSIEEGLFGVHIHKAGIWSKLVGTSSAGCQVFQNAVDFYEFIELCEVSASIYGNAFTYTLIDEV